MIEENRICGIVWENAKKIRGKMHENAVMRIYTEIWEFMEKYGPHNFHEQTKNLA